MNNVYITKTAQFLPNNPISNEEMGSILGFLDGSKRVKQIILRSNGIKQRYYAYDQDGNITHTNAELTYEAIKNLMGEDIEMKDIELLSVGTSSPDNTMPSHASMVHGLMDSRPIEINSSAGICTSGMNALKYAYMAIRSDLKSNAVVAGSERISPWLSNDKFQNELEVASKIKEQPILAFEKEFLRWMLSDGSGAFLLQNKPNPKSEVNIKIEWIEAYSFAFELDTCMYAGADKDENGKVLPWAHFSSKEWGDQSIFSIKQDVKLLDKHIIEKGVESVQIAMEKHQISSKDVTYLLPHISSFYFLEKLMDGLKEQGVNFSSDQLFTNLKEVGNVGAGSIFLMVDDLINSKKLKKGDTILLSVPESGRFNYVYVYLTVE